MDDFLKCPKMSSFCRRRKTYEGCARLLGRSWASASRRTRPAAALAAPPSSAPRVSLANLRHDLPPCVHQVAANVSAVSCCCRLGSVFRPLAKVCDGVGRRFSGASEAEKAVQNLDGLDIAGMRIKVTLAAGPTLCMLAILAPTLPTNRLRFSDIALSPR